MNSFIKPPSPDATGKTREAITKSQNNRSELIRLFGGVDNLPSSILVAKKGIPPADEDEHGNARRYNDSAKRAELQYDHRLPFSLRMAHRKSGTGCVSGALSRFPQNIGRTIVLLYSELGDTVFDPFAGHNSRMDLVVKAGRHYVGCDLSTEFMRTNRIRAKQLREKYPDINIRLHHTDSRKVPVESDSAQFTITSPPYYDIEYYGDEEEQLGKAKTYKDFLMGIYKVMKENFRVLQVGSYAAWFINDFRRKGKMHFYHMDVKRIGEKAGFEAVDILIVDLGKGIRDAFTNQAISTKILPKRHEYAIIFRKPMPLNCGKKKKPK